MRLSKKLILIFTLLVIISIIIISIISNTMINKIFETYLIGEREDKFTEIYQIINEEYIDDDFEIDGMELQHYALSEDVDIIIEDIDGDIIYDSTTYMNTEYKSRRGHRHRDQDNKRHNHHQNQNRNVKDIPKGKYVEKVYQLSYDDYAIGTLIIGYIDNAYLTEGAMLFKHTLTRSFIISGIATIFIGILVSVLISKRLTTPLVDIRNTANEIQAGNLNTQSIVKTDVKEIQELSHSINYLGGSLAQQEDIRKKYASDLSHELRTPLTTLKTYIEAIMDGVWDASKDNLNILMSEINRLNKLVEDLQDSFNAEEYNIILNKSEFNISKELKDIITTFIPVYAKEKYSINESIEDNIKVSMDKDKFKQIINNLLSNSFNYLEEDGNVFIKLWTSKYNLNLSIEDNGVGIKEKDLRHIFDRFYRVDRSRNKATGGSGLGLSIVKSIVEAHDGDINIESKYGKGTKIIMKFPNEQLY
ncbi:MAG TPA: ATP-binding protein [Tissierellaceae bacterium]|nr:ATP-binding protein [Tissierellaceae bacterium]